MGYRLQNISSRSSRYLTVSVRVLSRHEYAKDSSQTKNIITHGLLMLQGLMLHSLFGIPNKELIRPYLFSKFIIICIFGYSRDWPRSTKSELSLIPHLCNVVKVVLLYFDMQAQPLQSFMQSSGILQCICC